MFFLRMLGRMLIWTGIFSVIAGYMTRFKCDLGAECATGDKLECKTKYLDEMDDEDFIWEWTEGFGPSEPSALHSTVNRNGDVTDFTLHWRGPDDSSIRDLQGFQIDFEDGDIFHNFVMDLRGNDAVFKRANATQIKFHLKCMYNNPFSEAVTLRVDVTSLPKSLALTDKVITDNISIYIPKYGVSDIPRNVYIPSTNLVDSGETSATEGSGIIPYVILAVVLAFIIILGIPLFLKLKGIKTCKEIRKLEKRPNQAQYAVPEIAEEDDRDNPKVITPKKIGITEEGQKRICQEVCVPFFVEYETMTSLPHYEPCYHHLDSYDSGFHSDCKVPLTVDSEEKCDTEKEVTKTKMQELPSGTDDGKTSDNVGGPRLSWFHAPPSETESLTSLVSEDLEKEILRINKFAGGYGEKT